MKALMHSYLCLFTSARETRVPVFSHLNTKIHFCACVVMCVYVCVCGVLYIRVCSWKLILHIKFSDVLHLHFATLVSGSSLFLHSDTNLNEGKLVFMCVCVCVYVCVCLCVCVCVCLCLSSIYILL